MSSYSSSGGSGSGSCSLSLSTSSSLRGASAVDDIGGGGSGVVLDDPFDLDPFAGADLDPEVAAQIAAIDRRTAAMEGRADEGADEVKAQFACWSLFFGACASARCDPSYLGTVEETLSTPRHRPEERIRKMRLIGSVGALLLLPFGVILIALGLDTRPDGSEDGASACRLQVTVPVLVLGGALVCWALIVIVDTLRHGLTLERGAEFVAMEYFADGQSNMAAAQATEGMAARRDERAEIDVTIPMRITCCRVFESCLLSLAIALVLAVVVFLWIDLIGGACVGVEFAKLNNLVLGTVIVTTLGLCCCCLTVGLCTRAFYAASRPGHGGQDGRMWSNFINNL